MMPGPWQLLIILAVVLLLFGGRGKISAIMGDFGKGLRSFKTGLKGEEENAPPTRSRRSKQSPHLQQKRSRRPRKRPRPRRRRPPRKLQPRKNPPRKAK